MFEISQSSREDRLQIVFSNASLQDRSNMQSVQRVSPQKNADGVVTHFLFPHSEEANVRKAVEFGIQSMEAAAEYEAKKGEREIAAAAAAAKAAKKQAADAAKEQAVRDYLAAHPVNIVFSSTQKLGRQGMEQTDYVAIPYAEGVPSKMKNIWATWQDGMKVWKLTAGGKERVEAMADEIRMLVTKQRMADERKRAAGYNKPASRGSRSKSSGFGDAWNMDDKEFREEFGFTPRSEKDYERMCGTSDY